MSKAAAAGDQVATLQRNYQRHLTRLETDISYKGYRVEEADRETVRRAAVVLAAMLEAGRRANADAARRPIIKEGFQAPPPPERGEEVELPIGTTDHQTGRPRDVRVRVLESSPGGFVLVVPAAGRGERRILNWREDVVEELARQAGALEDAAAG